MFRGLPRPSYAAGFARNKSQSAFPSLWDGLMAQYEPGLGPTGPVLYDWAGRKLHGTLTNMTPTDWLVGQRGMALDYSGSNSYVDVPNPGSVLDGIGLSVAAWIRPESLSNSFPRIVDRVYNGQFAFYVVNSGSRLSWALATAGGNLDYAGTAPASTITLNIWQHAVLTYDGTAARMYVDGRLIDTRTTGIGGALASSSSSIFIGQRRDAGTTRAWNGQIGPVSIHSRALTPDEILLSAQGAGPLVLLPKRWAGFAAGGGSALTLDVSDAISLSDGSAKSVGAVRTDSFTVAELCALLAGKPLADALTLADSKALTFGQASLDSFELADALAHTAGLGLVDALNLADALAKAIGCAASDAMSLGDTVAKLVGKPLSDSLTLADSAQAVITLVLAVADELGLSDAHLADLAKHLSESITAADVLVKILDRQVGDTFTLLDVAAKLFGRPISDSFSLADASTQQILEIIEAIRIRYPTSVSLGASQSRASLGRSTTEASLGVSQTKVSLT